MINIKSLFKLEGKHKGKVKVTRGGKTFYREQELGRKEPEKKVPHLSLAKTELNQYLDGLGQYDPKRSSIEDAIKKIDKVLKYVEE